MHYTYEILNTENYKSYIGVRSCSGEPENDLGIKYFSSSSDKELLQEQKSKPEIFLYNILGVFDTREEALNHEIQLHKFYKVNINESFYNKAIQTSSGFDTTGNSGYKRTPKQNRKMSEILTGREFSEEHKNNISKNHADMSGENNPMYGTHRSGELNPMYGKEHSQNTKNKISEKTLGTKRITNGVHNKRAKEPLLSELLKNGYRLGWISWF